MLRTRNARRKGGGAFLGACRDRTESSKCPATGAGWAPRHKRLALFYTLPPLAARLALFLLSPLYGSCFIPSHLCAKTARTDHIHVLSCGCQCSVLTMAAVQAGLKLSIAFPVLKIAGYSLSGKTIWTGDAHGKRPAGFCSYRQRRTQTGTPRPYKRQSERRLRVPRFASPAQSLLKSPAATA